MTTRSNQERLLPYSDEVRDELLFEAERTKAQQHNYAPVETGTITSRR